jgi:hypothetical protein
VRAVAGRSTGECQHRSVTHDADNSATSGTLQLKLHADCTRCLCPRDPAALHRRRSLPPAQIPITPRHLHNSHPSNADLAALAAQRKVQISQNKGAGQSSRSVIRCRPVTREQRLRVSYRGEGGVAGAIGFHDDRCSEWWRWRSMHAWGALLARDAARAAEAYFAFRVRHRKPPAAPLLITVLSSW